MTIRFNDFKTQLAGKTLDMAAVAQAQPAMARALGQSTGTLTLNDTAIAKLWKEVDRVDTNGDAWSIGTTAATNLANFVFQSAKPAAGTPAANVITGGGGITLRDWEKVTKAGHDSVVGKQTEHWNQIDSRGIGTYYGDHSTLSDIGSNPSLNERQRIADGNAEMPAGWKLSAINYKEAKATGPNGATANLKETSCVGWVLENVAAAYKAAGLESRWNQIWTAVKRDGVTGTSLCKELQRDGWKAIRFSESGGLTDRVGGNYTRNQIKIDHIINDFSTPASQALIAKLDAVPFMVGVWNQGTHCFTGRDGQVSECHWDEPPHSKNVLEETGFAARGGDGIVMVPPGTF